MSSTDEVTYDAPATAKKKKVKKAVKKPARAAGPKESGQAYPGLTRTVCADACNAKGCVISGKSYCAHPVKGGLQSVDQTDPVALQRLNKARAQLDVRVDPDRFK